MRFDPQGLKPLSFRRSFTARLKSVCENLGFASGHDFSRAGNDAKLFPFLAALAVEGQTSGAEAPSGAGFFGMAKAMP